MSKTYPTTCSTIKDHLPKLWAFWACNDNEVFYLIQSRKGRPLLWKTLDGIQDSRDMILWNNKTDAYDALKKIMNEHRYPDNITRFQIGEVIPSYVDGGYWYEVLDGKYKDIKVK
jgi:hypothetical protein